VLSVTSMMRPRKISGHALHVLALLLPGADFDEHQLALDMLGFREIHHLHHVDQLVQLLGDLLDHVVRSRWWTIVMRDIDASSVGATVSDSML